MDGLENEIGERVLRCGTRSWAVKLKVVFWKDDWMDGARQKREYTLLNCVCGDDYL